MDNFATVRVDQSPTLIRRNQMNQYTSEIRSKVKKWCEASFGKCARNRREWESGQYSWWHRRNFVKDGGGHVFYFRDPGHAIIFKLTWAGK